MAKEKKTALTVTEAITEPSKPASPATPEDEQVAAEINEAKTLTQKERLDRIEAQLMQVDKNFLDLTDYIVKLNKAIEPLANIGAQLQARQAQTQIQPQEQPQIPDQITRIIDKALSGGENPLQEKMTQAMNLMLDKTIERITKPSAFEAYFEDELAKAKAKSMAASVLSAGS